MKHLGQSSDAPRESESSQREDVSVLGVTVHDTTTAAALSRCGNHLTDPQSKATVVFFVNAHTLNLAASDSHYKSLLNCADYVFGDGTGVRWAVRLIHGRRLLDNVNGTDLTPALFQSYSGKGLRYFLLGGTPEMIERAAAYASAHFSGWTLAGSHHGYLDERTSTDVVHLINAARPDLLLVGMGNPLQEAWIARYRDRLRVSLCMGVGGLFTYWSGDLDRAPAWMRRCGIEWMHLLWRQPHKARRYVLGNPLFICRSLLQSLDRRHQ
jgi:N-acetylglucosaminyldiphosphoundecaprenol N-acetyl-beta-D-mannosaminyltransferase